MSALKLKENSEILNVILRPGKLSGVDAAKTSSSWVLQPRNLEDISSLLEQNKNLLVDVDFLEGLTPHANLGKAIFVSHSNDPIILIELLHRHRYIHHLMSSKDILSLARVEHIVTQSQSKSAWSHPGLEEITISNYNQKNEILRNIAEYVNKAKVFKDLADRACTAASELMMNAVFDAPIDPTTGKAKYAALSRSESFALTESEYINLKYGFDAGAFVISVKDHFGSLTHDKIIDNLYRCAQAGPDQIRQGSGGAGVGLFLLFNLCSQLEIFIEPGISTEVVAHLLASKRQKDYESQEKMFNIYVTARS